jgi:transposase
MARPSLYDPAYCEGIVEHCRDGSSITSYAAEIGVCRDTISEWASVHEEFSVAVKRAKAVCGAWWEKTARSNATDGKGNAVLCIFGLKNMAPEDWRDKIETEHSGTVRVDRVERAIVDPANTDS